eukprot:GHUV01025858.1.p2 GENE.GHUV01025858.1~~GHUV01025858.1.p2  ORF type:complete len:101 (+),score=9.63 GHUV01025858.1:976-1278(+)
MHADDAISKSHPDKDAACALARTFAGWPSLTTFSPFPTKPSTKLSTAALVSAHASNGPMSLHLLSCCRAVLTRTSTRAKSVRVLPVPGGPCQRVRLRVTA